MTCHSNRKGVNPYGRHVFPDVPHVPILPQCVQVTAVHVRK